MQCTAGYELMGFPIRVGYEVLKFPFLPLRNVCLLKSIFHSSIVKA